MAVLLSLKDSIVVFVSMLGGGSLLGTAFGAGALKDCGSCSLAFSSHSFLAIFTFSFALSSG